MDANELTRVLSDPPFRFEMHLKRGSGAFFANRPREEGLLAERTRWLDSDPHRYAGARVGSEQMVQELMAFAAQSAPLSDTRYTSNDAASCCIELGKRWDPDFLLLECSSLEPTLIAGCVCFPSSWSLAEKWSLPLSQIHGPVPVLNAALGRSIGSFLERLKPDAEWERVNWGLAATPERNLHPDLRRPRLHQNADLKTTWLRVEHQALRRLPGTGAILFGIRIETLRLDEALRLDAGCGVRLAELLATMPQEIAAYKGLLEARDTLVKALRGSS